MNAPAAPLQFSLRDLLAATAVACLGLTLAQAPLGVWAVVFGHLMLGLIAAAVIWRRPVVVGAASGAAAGAFAGAVVQLAWVQFFALPQLAGGQPLQSPPVDPRYLETVLAVFQTCITLGAAIGLMAGVAWKRRGRREKSVQ
ncbi:MAG: hypothetical protein KDA44_20120 [Planctomycetales bacterium]|nr:hypothetical protein [Planctomycetales bacterium]